MAKVTDICKGCEYRKYRKKRQDKEENGTTAVEEYYCSLNECMWSDFDMPYQFDNPTGSMNL